MRDAAADTSFHSVLKAGETLLWKGRIGFNFFSAPLIIVILFGIAGYSFWATWGSYSLEEFCPPEDSTFKCGSLYALTPPGMFLIAVSQLFEMLERRALLSGKAQGAILVTDSRLIRVSDWPWHRVLAIEYLGTSQRWGLGGVIRFTHGRGVILTPKDKAEVLNLINDRRSAAP